MAGNGPRPDKHQYVALYDYGTGGVWITVVAMSAEQIARQYPSLRVVTIGDPEWVTVEKYTEILAEWIPPSMRFDIDDPTGWLRDSDATLSAPPPEPR
jgi:hypothetical protein